MSQKLAHFTIWTMLSFINKAGMESKMTIPELRELYQTQQLVEAIIEPSFQEGEWIVEFRHQMGIRAAYR